MENTDTAAKVRNFGFESVTEVAKLADRHPNTLRKWDRENPAFFELVLFGCYMRKFPEFKNIMELHVESRNK